MPSIVLSGCDGSGKTTLSRVLASYLSRYGSVRAFWFRGSHFLASLLFRILSRFRVFRGGCNPYYGVCIPRGMKWLCIHIEFWSAIPYILLRMMSGRLYRFTVFDRGIVDFVVWVITTLGYPGFLSSLYGRFLVRLASREGTVYLHADRDVLVERADTSPGFIYREYAVYSVLMRYLARCSIDTGLNSPIEAAVGVLKCMGLA